MRVFRSLGFCAVLGLGLSPMLARAQQPPPASADLRPVSNRGRTGVPETIEPSWDTRPDARTMYFQIPAPRGQITDRNGLPLAQSRLGYHLDLSFPTGDEMDDSHVVTFVKQQLVTAQSVMRRPLEVTTADVLDHYHNRRMLPMDIATYLTPRRPRRSAPNCPASLTSGCGPSTCAPIPTARWPRTSSATAARSAARPTARCSPTNSSGPTSKAARAWRKPSTSNSPATPACST